MVYLLYMKTIKIKQMKVNMPYMHGSYGVGALKWFHWFSVRFVGILPHVATAADIGSRRLST